VVGDTALLSEPGDVAGMTAGIEALIDDAAHRERLGFTARRRYQSRFSPAVMAEATIALMKAARARKLSQPLRP
jgi:glycosyltransferase involved in cell wall biosynthesis